MAVQIQFTHNISIKDGINCCLYGTSGVGKTMLSATAPNPLLLSAESGLLSLKKNKLNIPYIDISTYKELIEAYKFVTGSTEMKKYGTLCLDSMSEVSEVILAEEQSKTTDGRQAHGNTQRWTFDLMRKFRDLKGIHKYFICKEMKLIDGMIQKAVPVMPNSKLVNQTPYFFDLMLHMYVGDYRDANGQPKQFRAIHTNASTLWDAKDRSGNLDAIEYPDLGKIFAKAVA